MALTCACNHVGPHVSIATHAAAMEPCVVRDCPCYEPDPGEGAPRQAGMTASGRAIGAVDVLRELGLAVHVGTLVPSGPAVRLDIDDTARWLEPEEARTLAVALEQAAMDAVHEDRAARRG